MTAITAEMARAIARIEFERDGVTIYTDFPEGHAVSQAWKLSLQSMQNLSVHFCQPYGRPTSDNSVTVVIAQELGAGALAAIMGKWSRLLAPYYDSVDVHVRIGNRTRSAHMASYKILEAREDQNYAAELFSIMYPEILPDYELKF